MLPVVALEVADNSLAVFAGRVRSDHFTGNASALKEPAALDSAIDRGAEDYGARVATGSVLGEFDDFAGTLAVASQVVKVISAIVHAGFRLG